MMSLENNIWWTRKAKIENEARLLTYDFHAQFLLLWYSFFSVAMSILTITESSFLENNLGIKEIDPKLLIVFTVLSLFVSTFVVTQNFKERALKVKSCYEKLQIIYSKIKSNSYHENADNILDEYYKLLGDCENHFEKDYINAKVKIYLSSVDKSLISSHPTYFDFIRYWINKFVFLGVLMFFYTFPLLVLILI